MEVRIDGVLVGIRWVESPTSGRENVKVFYIRHPKFLCTA